MVTTTTTQHLHGHGVERRLISLIDVLVEATDIADEPEPLSLTELSAQERELLESIAPDAPSNENSTEQTVAMITPDPAKLSEMHPPPSAT